MARRIDARDVLDPNGRTRRTLRGRIIGCFRPTGPNSTDDYEFVGGDEGMIEISPDLPVQIERSGAQLRVRSTGGRVIRVLFEPTDAERAEIGDETPSALRHYLLGRYVDGFAEEPGRGAAAVIALKLRDE
jgi:hypothetical protein